MSQPALSPALALAIGAIALAGALGAAISAAPRLASWLAPAPSADLLAQAANPAEDLPARITAQAAGHGVEIIEIRAAAAGDAIVAQAHLRGDEARMLRFLQALETARPAFAVRKADISRARIASGGGVILEARLTIAARYAP